MVGQPNGSEKGANMIIVGCDYHPSFQQVVFVDTETEWKEKDFEDNSPYAPICDVSKKPLP